MSWLSDVPPRAGYHSTPCPPSCSPTAPHSVPRPSTGSLWSACVCLHEALSPPCTTGPRLGSAHLHHCTERQRFAFILNPSIPFAHNNISFSYSYIWNVLLSYSWYHLCRHSQNGLGNAKIRKLFWLKENGRKCLAWGSLLLAKKEKKCEKITSRQHNRVK